MAELVSEWEARGISYLAITDHCDFVTTLPAEPQTKRYVEAISRRNAELREYLASHDTKITVAAGIELGEGIYCEQAAANMLDQIGGELDFILGSLHYVDGYPDCSRINYRELDYMKLFEFYFGDLLKKHINWGRFDVCGHITYPFREIQRQGLQAPLDECFEQLSEALKLLIDAGKGIEINMSPVWAGNDPMPPLKLLKRYKELGGEILTIGSDDHKCLFAPKLAKAGAEIALAAGFEYFTVFSGRKPQMVKIN